MVCSYPKHLFEVPLEEFLLKGDITPGSESTVLFLHGAGTSTRRLFDSLRQFLYDRQVSSAAFDFIGHGESIGLLSSSSLEQRYLQACQVIDQLKLNQPLTIVGASMSGYTSIKLIERYSVENLILFVPAVYHAKAFGVPFDSGFSEIIREHRSWVHSDAWKILESFKGNLRIYFAENDDVIPKEIIDRIYESARNAKSRHCDLVRNSPHKIQLFLDQNPEERFRVFTNIYEAIHSFL